MARIERGRRALVDSNVLLDLVTASPWADWSVEQIAAARRRGSVAINPIVYAEVSIAFEDAETLDRQFPLGRFERLPLPWPAAFLAARCFVRYRQAGGVRRSPLPDFYIGAHAALEGMALLTRDAARYRTYFPTLELVAP